MKTRDNRSGGRITIGTNARHGPTVAYGRITISTNARHGSTLTPGALRVNSPSAVPMVTLLNSV